MHTHVICSSLYKIAQINCYALIPIFAVNKV
jgi:hypothetical protein